MYCWYLRNMYLENRLREPGGTVQCGVPVDLSGVTAPAFIYASREDHIVPWQTAYASTQLLGGENRFVLGASGHIAGVINPAARNKRNTGERASMENGPSAGWRRRARCPEAGGRTGAPGFVLTPARRCGHARAWAAPRFPRSSRRPAATLRCAPPEPGLETRGGKS